MNIQQCMEPDVVGIKLGIEVNVVESKMNEMNNAQGFRLFITSPHKQGASTNIWS